MSLHAQLSQEAQAALNAQRRRSTLSSIGISILVLVVLGLILGFIFLDPILKETPVIVSYASEVSDDDNIEQQKQTKQVQKKPSAPASAMTKVIVSNSVSNTAIPVPDFDVPEPSADFGDANDFGDGFADGSGAGQGGGPISPYGSTNKSPWTLEGRLYDLKQKPSGEPVRGYDTNRADDFTTPVKSLQRSGFSESALSRHYGAKQKLYLRYVAVPFSDANAGPKYFNAQKEVKPSGWIAHYHGKVRVTERGRYRLVGMGDDYLAVLINKKKRLIACWPNIQQTIASGWRGSKGGDFKSPFGPDLIYGDWMDLELNQVLEIDIALGERPGGKVGFILMVEKEGEQYRKAGNGRPILPPFTVGPLDDSNINNLKKVQGWKWETKNVPVFMAE